MELPQTTVHLIGAARHTNRPRYPGTLGDQTWQLWDE